MKKRLLSLVLVLCMLISAMPSFVITADAAEIIRTRTYENMSWTLYSEGTLVISGSGEMIDIVEIGDTGWLGYNEYEVIRTVIIEYGITTIEHGAFSGCTSLESITIPNSVTTIGGGAFGGCTSLESITIPGSVTTIEGDPFRGCSNLTSITVSRNNLCYSSIDGVLFNSDRSEISCFPAGKCEDTYNIPDSVTSIGMGAFAECTSLKNITIPDSVTSIGMSAFAECTSLKNITIPNSVTDIGASAFFGCTSLKDVTIPNSVTTIDSWTFAECYNMQNITIFDSVISIGEGAFDYSGVDDVYFIALSNTWDKIEGNTELKNAEIHFCSKLFYEYPEYLNNYAFFDVIRSCSETIGYTIDNIPIGKFKFGKYLHVQANMGKIVWDSIAEAFCMSNGQDYTDSLERFQDEQLLELLREIESSSSVIKGIVSDVGDAFRDNMKYMSGAADIYNFAYTTSTAQFASDLSQATGGIYSTEDIEDIVSFFTKEWGDAADLLDKFGKVLEPAEVITTVIMTDMVSGKLVDLLIKKVPKGTDLYDSLMRMNNRRDVLGKAQYVAETYLAEKVLEKLFENTPKLVATAINYISNATVTPTQLSLAYNIANFIVNSSVWVVQKLPGALVIDDYNATVINWDNVASFRNILDDDIQRFFINSKLNSSTFEIDEFMDEIDDYEIIYCGLMGSMRSALENARKLTTNKSTQAKIDEHIKQIDAWNFEYYIQSCVDNVSNTWGNYYTYTKENNGVKITGISDVMVASTDADYNMLVIPDTIDGLPVTAIADSAFAGYATFNAVIIPDSVTAIGIGAFEGCSQLSAAIIGEGVTKVSENSFKDCSSLISVDFSENTKTIGGSAFENCSSLSEVIIPESVEAVEANAFSGNSALTEVTVLGENSQLSETTFANSTAVTVKAYENSAAKTFAENQNLSFEALAPVVTKIEITKLPDKLRFKKGEAIDASGMELQVTYNDGSVKTATDGWILSCDISTSGKQAVTVFYGEGTSEYEVIIEATWTTDTDAGYYSENGKKLGLMRYLFHADINGEVTESGIKFIKSETDDTQVGNIIKGIPSKTFYGDLINIPENTAGMYFAKGFVVVDGVVYWSTPLGCMPDFKKEFKR